MGLPHKPQACLAAAVEAAQQARSCRPLLCCHSIGMLAYVGKQEWLHQRKGSVRSSSGECPSGFKTAI